MTTIPKFREAVEAAIKPIDGLSVQIHDDAKFSPSDINTYSIAGQTAAIICFVGTDGLTPATQFSFEASLKMAVVILAKGHDRAENAYNAGMKVASAITSNDLGIAETIQQSDLSIVPYSDDSLVKKGVTMLGVLFTQTVFLEATDNLYKPDTEPTGDDLAGADMAIHTDGQADANLTTPQT
ncbi:hypothetical protein [Ahrensia sp. R2A130]|uniref:hypothetical protein n=1 Tax=Ahrensia sp. R2A130 TaxID=744979 RepID=UPI0001E0B515|nr:hypothetical protein [Ahrensia sp. R2A130]EFL88291.1 hypothetical protein R2A130_3458 [Ahrensia sp. R2A130]